MTTIEKRKYPRVDSLNLSYVCIDNYGEIVYEGMGRTLNVSENGMFIMISKDFTKNMVINIELPLSNDKMSFLNGIITRNRGISGSNWLIGAGIRLTEKDEIFHNFLATLN